MVSYEKSYLDVGNARDLTDKSDYALYRFFEILPGAIAWFTLAGIFLASWLVPVWASFFIILFDLYWLIKTVFLSFHLRAAYQKMQEHIRIDWLQLARNLSPLTNNLQLSWNDIYHLVILPFYNEPYEVMRESLASIAHSNYPKEKIFVVLAREERAGEEAKITAQKLEQEFGQTFFKFLVTAHPADVPGEFPGKGSNESFACSEAKVRLIDLLHIPYERVIVSSLDSDTKVYPDYFASVSYHYLTVSDPLRASYQPIPVYNNNIWSSPALSRVVATSGTFWQMMQQARPERLTTFSSHSMPFIAIVEMDFWNKKNVSEDSRIFWKALLFYDGAYRVVPLYYPVSLDANMAPHFFETARNVYRQQRRWGWGVENIPYAFFGFWKNKKIRFGVKLYYGFNQLEGFWSWATNSLMIFLLGWMPVLLGGAAFNTSVLSYNLPRITRLLMTVAMFGLITSAIYSTRLLPPRPAGHLFRKYLWMILQWILVPITIIFFGSFPGLEAQTRLMLGKYMSFWVTPKYRGD